MGDSERSFLKPFSREASVREQLRRERKRLPWWASPLDPYHAVYPANGGEEGPYMTAATRHIHNRLIGNSLSALESGLLVGNEASRRQLVIAMNFTDYDHPESLELIPGASAQETQKLKQIIDLAGMSLYAAQVERIEYHARHPVNHIRHANSRRVRAAKEGLAMPHELLGILEENPSLQSIELTKLSHPFDLNATADMEAAVMKTLRSHGKRFVPSSAPIRTKIKRIDSEIPACIAVTKKPIGTIMLPNGQRIEAIDRRSRLVRGDETMWPYIDEPINRLITNPNRSDELISLINETLGYSDYTPWLLPLTTSAYAAYVQR